MAIEWDGLITEMVILGSIIYGAIYVENWVEKRKARHKEREEAKRTIRFVTNDLENKLRFIDDSVKFRDFKPFFTNMWDAVIMGGRQTVLPFELFEDLQHTYSWMKYYNNEVEQRSRNDGENEIAETLGEVRESIRRSIEKLKKVNVT